MAAYYFIFVVLWTGSFITYLTNSSKLTKAIVTGISILACFIFVGFRLETGYDWYLYTEVYNNIKRFSFNNFHNLIDISNHYSFELLFVIYYSLLKWISSDFIFSQIISSLILFSSTYSFLRKITPYYLIVFTISYCWLFVSVYFSVVRQSISISLFLIFILLESRQRKSRSILLLITAVLIQYSSIIYFILYYIAKLEFIFKYRKFLLLLSVVILALSTLGFNISIYSLELIIKAGIPFITQKLDWYIHSRTTNIAIYDYVFVYTFTIVVGYFLLKSWQYAKTNKTSFIIYNFCILYIVLQAFFIDYPIFRNRIMYVGFTLAVTVLVTHYRYGLMKRLIFTASLSITLLYLTLFLNINSSLPFIPYKNYILSYFVEYEDDSLDRVKEYLSNF